MSVLQDVIGNNVDGIEEDLESFICDKLINKELNVYVGFSVQGGFTNGWSNQIVFNIHVSIYENEDEIFSESVEISCLHDFESEVLGMLGELVE